MTTPTTTREAEAYLAEVREHLGDLSEEERAELLQDLAQHLADVSTDEGNPDTDLRQLLGSPTAYAAELRSAAGLPPRVPAITEPKQRPAFLKRLLPLWNHRWVRGSREFLHELAPAWWLVRGYLVAVLPRWIDPYQAGYDDFPIPRYADSPELGVVVVVVAMATSVLLGRWGRRGRQPWRVAGLVALNGLVVVAALNAYGAIGSRYVFFPRDLLLGIHQLAAQANEPPSTLASRNGVVTNIYPYDAGGNPLENVLLFDQDGRPLRVGMQEWWPDGCRRIPQHPRAADGVPVEFSYPQNYGLTTPPEGRTGVEVPAEGCWPTIPRPAVPIPTFPAAPPQP